MVQFHQRIRIHRMLGDISGMMCAQRVMFRLLMMTLAKMCSFISRLCTVCGAIFVMGLLRWETPYARKNGFKSKHSHEKCKNF